MLSDSNGATQHQAEAWHDLRTGQYGWECHDCDEHGPALRWDSADALAREHEDATRG